MAATPTTPAAMETVPLLKKDNSKQVIITEDLQQHTADFGY